MAFTTMAQILAALPGQRIDFSKIGTNTAGTWSSPWLGAGLPPAGSAPSSGLAGDVPTKDTVGALALVNSGAGDLFCGRLHAGENINTTDGMVWIYDRLWHNSGISATAVTAQTINSVALTRPDANGANVEAWWQVYVVMGAGTPNVTLTYTDQDGNTGNTGTSGVLATTMAVGRTGPFSMASGDTGVRSIQTWQSDATFTSGTIGLVLRRPLLCLPFDTGLEKVLDVLACGLASIPDNACLEFITLCNSNATMTFQGSLLAIEG